MSGGDQGWQVGDLALCISTDGFYAEFAGTRTYPTIGLIRRVRHVFYHPERIIRRWFRPNIRVLGGIWLVLDGFEALKLHSNNFRKIEPHAPDQEDTETIRLLNGQPVTPVGPKMPELV